MKNGKPAVDERVALADLSKFLGKYKKRDFRTGEYTEDKIKEDFPDVLEAIKDGLLIFQEDGKPVFTLREPVLPASGDEQLAIKTIEIRTRVKPSDKARIMDGINIQTQSAKYVLRYLAYITGLSIAELDLLDPEDYDVLSQLSSVF